MLIDGEELSEWLEEMAQEYRRLILENEHLSNHILSIWKARAEMCELINNGLGCFKK